MPVKVKAAVKKVVKKPIAKKAIKKAVKKVAPKKAAKKIAKKKISEFAKREAEFEKRTAFSLIAALASHDKKMEDKDFIKFFSLIKRTKIKKIISRYFKMQTC